MYFSTGMIKGIFNSKMKILPYVIFNPYNFNIVFGWTVPLNGHYFALNVFVCGYAHLLFIEQNIWWENQRERREMGQKHKCEKAKIKKRPQKRTVTYGSYHKAMLPSVSTAPACWHPKATAQDGSNPWDCDGTPNSLGTEIWPGREEEVDGL